MTVKTEQAPRVGCGALITNEKGEILLVKRLREPEAGFWGFPGGKVDFGETIEAAICREIKEELGILIELQELAHLVNYIDIDLEQHWLAPVYDAIILSGAPRIQEPLALSSCAWFAIDCLPDQITEATHQTLASKIKP
ncbi:MAG: NUDIX domain-containing protein [Sneathiella sp.]|nr:NUDIX domain-containing protein [Sneathiella sp.]